MKEKIKVTAQQRANAIEARDVMWPSVPAKNVVNRLYPWRLGSAHEAPTCGTAACSASPQAQSLTHSEHTRPRFSRPLKPPCATQKP